MKYLYKTPSGVPELHDHELPPGMFDHMTLVRTYQDNAAPELQGKAVNDQGQLVPVRDMFGYRARRAELYPPIPDMLDTLWHAMDTGLLPKVPDFYNPIKAVKDANPKDAPAGPV